MEAGQVDVAQELARLRTEIERLRAARRRLVLAADDDRRAIERALHDGVHQHLVAIAVDLQLARRARDSDPEAVGALFDEMGTDVERALDETALLAQRTYPVSLEAEGLAALLRSAAVSAAVPASVDVQVGSSYPPEVVMTVYLCWLDALASAANSTRVTIEVHESEDVLAFEIVADVVRSDADIVRTRDRVEALGGQLTIGPTPAGEARLSGSLPRSR